MTFDLRAVVYNANGARRGVLSSAQQTTATTVLNDVPALTLKVPRDADGGIFEGFVEVAVEYSDGGAWVEPANSRFIKLAWDTDRLKSIPVVTGTLPGYAWLLSTAKVREAANPTEANTTTDGKRKFTSANAGTILSTLIAEAKTRGALPGLTLDFSTTKDSSGASWSKVVTLAYTPGLGLHQVLDNLAAQGMVDWQLQGRTLRVFNPEAGLAADLTTRANPVSLLIGRDVEEAPDQGDATGLLHRAYLRGDEGKTWEVTSTVAPAPWGSFEATIDQGGVSDQGTAMVLIEQALADGSQERVQMTRALVFNEGSWLPHRDYSAGNFIFAPGAAGLRERLRVHQITLTRDSAGDVSGNVVLNDRFVEASIRRAKRTEGITGGSKLGGGSGATPAPVTQIARRPAAPANVVVSSTPYTDRDGNTQARALVLWDAVTKDVNDRVLDRVDSYRVEVLQQGATHWQSLGSSTTTSLSYGPLPAGTTARFAVAAVSEGLVSARAEVGPVLLESDVTPPPVPSKPVLTSRLGVVTVTWDGKSDQAGGMPSDFDRIDVYATISGTTKSVGSIRRSAGADFVVVTDLPYNTLVPFWFRSVDRTGNASVASVQTSISVKALVDADLVSTTVQSALDDLNSRLGEIPDELEDLSDALAPLRDLPAELATAKAATTAVANRVTPLEALPGQLATANEAVTALATRVTPLEDLPAELEDARDDVAGIAGRLTPLEALPAELAAAKAATTAVASRVDPLEGLPEELAAAKAATSSLSTTVGTVSGVANAAKTAAATADGKAVAAQSKADAAATAAATADGKAATAKSAADAAQSKANAADAAALAAKSAADAAGITDFAPEGEGRWLYERINRVTPSGTVPDILNFAGVPFDERRLVSDSTRPVSTVGEHYLGAIHTNIYLAADTTLEFNFQSDDGGQLLIDNVSHHIGGNVVNTPKSITLTAGWHTVDALWVEHSGGDYVGFTPALGTLVDRLVAPSAAAVSARLATLAHQRAAEAKADAATADGKAVAAQSAADAAASAASAAQGTANTALTSANGKNKIVFSANDPWGTSYSTGDVWFKRYESTGRIAMQWEFVNGKWSGRELDNTMIANLDAGKITAGTISADRIGGKTITADKLVVGSAAEVLADPGFEDGGLGWNLDSRSSVVEAAGSNGGKRVLQTTAPNSSDFTAANNRAASIGPNGLPVAPGQTFRFSVKVRRMASKAGVNSNVRMRLCISKDYTDGRTWPAISGMWYDDMALGVWYEISGTYTIPAGYNMLGFSLHISNGSAEDVIQWDDASMKVMSGGELIVDGAITAGKIATDAIVADKIMANAVTTAKIATNAVTANEIAAGTITATEIKADAITAAKIKAGEVTAGKLATDSVVAANIVAGAVSTSELAAEAVTAEKIKAGTITAAEIKAGTITATELATNSVTADEIAANAVTAGSILARNVTTEKIATNAVTANEIKAGTITATEIASSAITAIKINADAVTTEKIAAGAVTADQIAANSITAAKIRAGSITADRLLIGTSENLLPNGNGELHGTAGFEAFSYDPIDTPLGSGATAAFTMNAAHTGGIPLGGGVKHEAGRKYVFSFWIRAVAAGSTYSAMVWLYNSAGERYPLNLAYRQTVPTAWTKITLPVDLGQVMFSADEIVPVLATNASGSVVTNQKFAAIRFARQTNSVLIEDGAITGDKIFVRSITTEKIATNAVTANEIKAGTITASELATNSITADKITAGHIIAEKIALNAVTTAKLDADAITAKHTITGATIQTTATASRGIKVTSAGINAYSSTGTNTFSVSSAGNVTVAGTVRSGTGDNQVVMSDQIGRGRPGIRFDTGDSSAFQPMIQSLGVGSDGFSSGSLVINGRETTANSSGRADLVLEHGGDFTLMQNWGSNSGIGISKAGAGLNLRGLLTSSHDRQDMFVRGKSAQTQNPSGTFTFTFGSPSRSGVRTPQITVDGNTSASAATRQASASQFIVSYSGPANNNTSIRYLAVWEN